ncbi:hypothetical protein Q8F55_002482 [Vanrija albida]|uniref:Uncharacterized protein n=1 Tax=Vanrija albida TaxID=181172 RepID=A0ABR3Q9X4_9TREE
MPPKPSSESWNDDHTLLVVRHVVASALAARPALYAQPGLSGVSNNGGDRINKKLQQVLGQLTKQFPGAEAVIKEEVAKHSSRGKTGTKRKSEEQGGGAVKKERSG